MATKQDLAQARHDVNAAFDRMVGMERAFFRRVDRGAYRTIEFGSDAIEGVLRAMQGRLLAPTRARRRRRVFPLPIRVYPR